MQTPPDAKRANVTVLPASLLPAPGEIVAEHYRLDCIAGRTEAGVVFDATDLAESRRVAVEIASSIEEPNARRKWTRDAMLAQRLRGEHVLRVLDIGALGNGTPYVVREAATSTVADELERRRAIPVAQAAAWTLEACEAIAEAHALGMAHGDLRLDNVYLAGGPLAPQRVKVAWTSAAKAERAAKEDVARDIAALGAMLRLLVTGRVDQEVDSAPTLPSDVAQSVARALAEDPADAFHDVVGFARSIAPLAPAGHGAAKALWLMPPPPPVWEIARSSERPSITDWWFGEAALARQIEAPVTASQEAPARRHAHDMERRRMVFAMVSLALIGGVLAGSLALMQSKQLPRWTGTAPPDDVTGTTELTSANVTTTAASTTTRAPAAAAAMAAAATELVSRPVESLPDAPPLVATSPPVFVQVAAARTYARTTATAPAPSAIETTTAIESATAAQAEPGAGTETTETAPAAETETTETETATATEAAAAEAAAPDEAPAPSTPSVGLGSDADGGVHGAPPATLR